MRTGTGTTAGTAKPTLHPRIVRMAGVGDLIGKEKDRRSGVATHAEGVARLANELAADVGIAGADLDELTLAARVHDVGKLSTPDKVFNKPGKLDEAEFACMRTHARDGAAMLRARGLPNLFADVARFHHEDYDGLGYERLKGEGIPYAARIVQVCDVFDALREPRAYKPAFTHGRILHMMTDMPGEEGPGRSKHDPVLLRRFVALRLRDPATALDADDRAAFEAFVRSDPNEDLGPGSPRRFAADEGARAGLPDPRAAMALVGPDLHADIDAELGLPPAPDAGAAYDEDDDMPSLGM